MAYFGRHTESFNASRTIKIPTTETIENYTVYIIEVSIGPNKWTIRHRYSEFHELHEKLVLQYKLDKNLLPPKKLFGNQSEAFVKKRQRELEIYLQTVLHHLSNVPLVLALFLDFPRYEIHSITETLAEDLYDKGDMILQTGETFHVTPLQLNAITTRLKLPEPTCESGDPRKDLGHVLDFVTRLKYLKILGSDKPIGSSNMVMNRLNYDMNMFKILETLEMCRCNCVAMECVDGLKKTVKTLRIHETVGALKDVMLLGLGQVEWTGSSDESLIVTAWAALTVVDLSHNSVTNIDESVKLMPRCEFLDLSHNHMEDITNLNYLSALTHLDVSHNNIRTLNSLHTKLGNIKTLNLAGNKIESLLGFSKLYSLENLDLTGNEISQVLEVRHVACLPCLENLKLVYNPVTIVVDYRTKILELFGDRAPEIVLDNQKATQKEIDTVAILLALQKSKQAKTKPRRQPAKKPAVEAKIAESSGNQEGNHSNTESTATASSNQNNSSAHPSNQSVAEIGQSLTCVQGQSTSAMGQVEIAHRNDLSADPMNFDLESYRRQVEAIRNEAGPTWLSMLNKRQQTGSNRASGTNTPSGGRFKSKVCLINLTEQNCKVDGFRRCFVSARQYIIGKMQMRTRLHKHYQTIKVKDKLNFQHILPHIIVEAHNNKPS